MQEHFKRVSNRPCSYRIELHGYVEEVFRLTFLANDLNHADGAVANFFCFHTSVCEQDEFFRTASELLPQLMIVEFGQLDHNFHWEKLTIAMVKSKREYRQYGWNRFFYRILIQAAENIFVSIPPRTITIEFLDQFAWIHSNV